MRVHLNISEESALHTGEDTVPGHTGHGVYIDRVAALPVEYRVQSILTGWPPSL